MSRKTTIQVTLSGQDITSDLTGDVLSLTYTDNAKDNSDSIDFTIQNRDKKWLKSWFPNKKDTLHAIIRNWNGVLNCGDFLVDDVEMSGGPLTVSIKGVAMPTEQDFSEVKHNKTWEQATLKDIASTIAGKAGVALEYLSDNNPTIDFQTQNDECDMSFLASLAEKYGVTMKVYSKKIILYDLEKLEAQGSIKTIREGDILSGWRGKTTLLDTAYSGVQVSYTNPDGELLTYTETAGEDKAPKLYKHDVQVSSVGEAEKIAKAKLKALNIGETTFSCSLPGDPALVSGVNVELSAEDFGKFGGKYFIDSSTHTVGGGYVTSLEMHRVD